MDATILPEVLINTNKSERTQGKEKTRQDVDM